MAEKDGDAPASLWDNLPKKERERITRELLSKRESKPAPEAKRRNGVFNLRGYARCELSASDKEAFRLWEETVSLETCLSNALAAATDGYLLKLGATGNGYQASYSAATTEKPWDGYVLVAHAGTAERVVKLLTYKHEVLMEKDWADWLGEEGEDALR
jgi:hypothetical protein